MFNIPIFETIRSCGYAIYNFFAYFGQLFSTKLIDNNIPLSLLKQSFYNPFSNTLTTIDLSNGFLDDNFIKLVNQLVNDIFNMPQCNYVYEIFIYLAMPLALLFFTLGIVKHILKIIP